MSLFYSPCHPMLSEDLQEKLVQKLIAAAGYDVPEMLSRFKYLV